MGAATSALQPQIAKSWLRRIARHIWLRGFLPSLLLLALWVFSLGTWILWQGAPTPELRRATLSQGAITYCWYTPGTWRVYGHCDRPIGFDIFLNGRRPTWYASEPLWKWGRGAELVWDPSLAWKPVIEAGAIQIPVFYLAILAAIPPLKPVVRMGIRACRRPPWACSRCGYDLRAATHTVCPECGSAIAATTRG
jgi:hypothetical protein